MIVSSVAGEFNHIASSVLVVGTEGAILPDNLSGLRYRFAKITLKSRVACAHQQARHSPKVKTTVTVVKLSGTATEGEFPDTHVSGSPQQLLAGQKGWRTP